MSGIGRRSQGGAEEERDRRTPTKGWSQTASATRTGTRRMKGAGKP